MRRGLGWDQGNSFRGDASIDRVSRHLELPAAARYLMAAAVVALTLLVRWAIFPSEAWLSYRVFFPGLVLTAFLCGTGPSVFYVFLSIPVAVWYSETFQVFRHDGESQVLDAATYAIAGLAVVALIHAFRRLEERRWRELAAASEERRQIEEAFAKSQRRLVGAIDSAMDAIITVDEELRLLSFNPAAERLFACSSKDVIGACLDRFLPDDVRAGHAEHIRRFAATGVSSRSMGALGELRARKSDGTEFPIEASISQLDLGGERVFTVILRDITARKESEMALQESEARFREMADSAPILIWIAGSDGGCTWFNQQWLGFTGREMTEELGDGWVASVHPDDVPDWLATYRRNFARRERFEMEYRLRRADGEYRWILARGIPRFRQGNEFVGYIGSCADITTRKQVEQDLVHAQAVGRVGSWRLNVRKNELTWSKEAYRIFGIPEGRPLTYEDFLECVHPEDRIGVDQAWQAALKGVPYDIDHRLLVDGSVRWVREKAELEFDGDGNLLGGFGITQDITDMWQAQEALRASEERFRSFMANSPVASWIVDAQGRFEYVSPVYSEMFNVGVADPTGRLVAEVYPESLACEYLAYNERVLQGGQPVSSVEPGVRPDGVTGEFFVVKFPIRDADGRMRVGGMALDITETRNGERRLFEVNERLTALLRSLPVGVSFSGDPDCGVLQGNPALTSLFDFPPGSNVDAVTDVTIGASRVRFFQGDRELQASELPLQQAVAKNCMIPPMELSVRLPQGRTWTAEISGAPIHDAQGRVSGGLAVSVDISARKAVEADLLAANARLELLAREQARHLRELSKELTNAEQLERDRLYQLLHDEVQPLLVAARLSLSSVGTHSSMEYFLQVATEARSHITTAIQTARRLSTQLSPPLVRERGLVAALDFLRRWFQANCGLAVNLANRNVTEPAEAATRLVCFNAVRELLLNVVKHAHTTQAEVELDPDPAGFLRITVSDHGSGFAMDSSSGDRATGTGLSVIERRLGMLGGAVDIKTMPGKGTTVRLFVPLEQSSP